MAEALNIVQLREDFPILSREVYPGIPLIYLDSTATTQKPYPVLQAMDDFYRRSNANIHRGVHTLAEEATAMYEQAREKVARFIDDPCDEGGYDAFCRNRHGQLCGFHEEHCHAPDYPCIDLLRHALAVSFLEEIEERRKGS